MLVLTMTEYINREAIRDALYDADAAGSTRRHILVLVMDVNGG